MVFIEYKIGDDDIDRRIDRVVRKFLKTVPLSVVYKNIRSGFIRVNNFKVKIDYRMSKGDIVFIEKNFLQSCSCVGSNVEPAKNSLKQSVDFETVFINEHIQVVNKPYGINVQSAKKNEVSLDSIIKDQFTQKKIIDTQKESLSFLPGPLHRLDKNTTGLICFSQSIKGARYVSDIIYKRKMYKEYLTVFSGTIANDCIWEHYIKKDSSDNKNTFSTVRVYSNSNECSSAKFAKTFVFPLANGLYFDEEITIAKVHIETGRTHQIRSQGAFCNHPLLGDSAYGYKGKAKSFFLHAWKVCFPIDNPIGLPEKLIANLPISFKNFLFQYLPNFSITSYN